MTHNTFKEIVDYKASVIKADESCIAYLRNMDKFVCIAMMEVHWVKHMLPPEIIRNIWTLSMNKSGNCWKDGMINNNLNCEVNRCVIQRAISYNDVIICFVDDHSILCLDMVDNKWYKSQRELDAAFHFRTENLISTAGGRFCYYHNDRDNRLYKIDLFDCCPRTLQRKIQERINIRNITKCFGYCRKYEMTFNIIIPRCLKEVVIWPK